MHTSAKESHPCPGPRTPSLSSLGRQLGKNKSGLSVMHPGKKSLSSLIKRLWCRVAVYASACAHTASRSRGVCRGQCHVWRAQTHLCMGTLEWASAFKQHGNLFKQTTRFYSIMPIDMCAFHMMYENTHICTPFLPYVHTHLFYCNICISDGQR